MTELIQIDKESARQSVFDGRVGTLKSLTQYQSNQNLSEIDKIKLSQAARGFESIFINMMVKEMKNAMLEKNDDETTFGADTLIEYGDLMLSDEISNSGRGIGIANLIYKQLTGEELVPITTVNPAKQYEMYEADSVFQSSFQKDNIFFIDSLSKKLNETKNKFNEKISQFDDIITAASIKYDIPKSLIKAIIIAESAGNPAAISKSGAKGLMQLMDATALDLGVKDSFDPEENIFGGTLYIKQMLHRFNDNLDFALAAYNAGPGNVDKFNGIPPFNETQSYIVKVKRYNEMFQASNF